VSTLLVVGAGPRLGGAIARRFGAAGYDVALLSDDEASVTGLGETLQGEGVTTGWAVADTRDDAAVQAAIGRFAEHTGGIDVVVHNVSVWRDASVLDLTTEQVLEDVHAGAASLFPIAQAVAPAMIAAGGGTILATGSAAADAPSPGAPTLALQKAALRAAVRVLALELGPQGVHCATVTINGVLGTPGFDPSSIADLYYEIAGEPPESWRTVVPYNGLHR
jgi:NAD(P)-dependent dehydrogenase (short-subunit alcohol dehydrogenase family)